MRIKRLSQKEFGIVTKIRDKLFKNLTNKIEKKVSNYNNIQNSLNNGRIIKNPTTKKVRSNIYRLANNSGARISKLNLSNAGNYQSPQIIPNKELLRLIDAEDITTIYKNKPKKLRKLKNSILNNNRHQIILPRKTSGIDLVAHEIGHIKNKTSKNPITKLIYTRSENISSESNKRINNLNSIFGTSGRSGLKALVKDIIDEECLIAEERSASKRAIKLLKNSGATKDELKIAKRNYKTALDSYKNKGRANWLDTLRNTI